MKIIIKYILIIAVLIFTTLGAFYYYKSNFSRVTVYISDIDKVKIYYVRNGKQLEKLENPSMDGYAFAGWYYLDSDDFFDFDKTITEDIKIVAKWVKINI